jgi:triacylglycerol lipase
MVEINRRQVLLGGIAAGVAATVARDYASAQQQAQLEALAKAQLQNPRDADSLLEATFNADAEKIFQGQAILDSLKLTPPTLPYDRPLSQFLIQCSKLATQQYLTGKTLPGYDGSIQSLPEYGDRFKSYTQVASFRGRESEISESVEVQIPQRQRSNDPLENSLGDAEGTLGQTIQEVVKIRREIPVYLGFALSSPQHNIIVFRGTQTTAEWINNLTARQIAYTDPLSGQYFGRIHEGFINNYLRIISPIPRDLAQTLNPNVPCYVTGHSLGSSLAILAALDIALNASKLQPKLQLYTYASPRVGDPTFARLHSKMIPNSYRIVNLADVFPLMPPTISRVGTYVHVGQEWSFLSQNNDFMPNHVVDTYRKAIDEKREQLGNG